MEAAGPSADCTPHSAVTRLAVATTGDQQETPHERSLRTTTRDVYTFVRTWTGDRIMQWESHQPQLVPFRQPFRVNIDGQGLGWRDAAEIRRRSHGTCIPCLSVHSAVSWRPYRHGCPDRRDPDD